MYPVNCNEAPPANGHYSHAVVHEGTVYVSGQLGRGPGMTDEQAGDIDAQTRRALASLRSILKAAGTDLDRLVKVTIYVSDITLWPAVNAAYTEVLSSHRPARAVVPTMPLHFGALIEIEAIAALSTRVPGAPA